MAFLAILRRRLLARRTARQAPEPDPPAGAARHARSRAISDDRGRSADTDKQF